jgi:type II secretory pathway component PulF
MPKYYYKAKRGPSDFVEDTIDASNRDEAVEKISRLGYLPVVVNEDIKQKKEQLVREPAAISFFSSSSVRSKDVTIFSRQLSSLLKSGIPILRALQIIGEQSESAALNDCLKKVSKDVKEGKSFSAALEGFPKVFSLFFIALVKSGEDSGTLQEALLRVANYRQKQEEMFAKMRSAMAYPVLMALVGIGTVIFMFTFVMPKLMSIFSTMGQDLPLPTRIVIGISVALRRDWAFIAIGAVVLFILVSKTSTFQARKKIVSLIKLHIPVFNKFFLYNEFARFSRTLEVLIRSGIPILRAISISIPILENEIIKGELSRSAKELEEGASFGKSLRKSKLFPAFMISLIAVGEESGKLDDALAEIADTYEYECDEAIKVATSLLEPLMILVMGLVVGFIVVAMLLPIFQINMMVK